MKRKIDLGNFIFSFIFNFSANFIFNFVFILEIKVDFYQKKNYIYFNFDLI